MKIELDDTLKTWSKYAKVYDPIKCASIDGTDCEPHDRAVVRAVNSTYKPNRFVKGRPECTIFVSRLNHDTSKDTIKDIFSKYGKLKRFRMVKDIVTGMPKGYAFVEYEQEQAAEEAYRLANKMVVDGNIIFVDFECERLLKGWKPRRLGGGFAGKKESGQLRFGCRDRPFKKPIALELKEQEDRKEKDRRAREMDRRRRDKSRDRHNKRSPVRENGINSPSRSKKKIDYSTRDKGKRPLSPQENGSPPRKQSRHRSPPKENGHIARSPHREKNISKDVKTMRDVKRRTPSREKNRKEDSKFSPSKDADKQRSQDEIMKSKCSSGEKNKDKSPTRDKVKVKPATERNDKRKSPSKEETKKKSPSKENTNAKSPSRVAPKSPSKENVELKSPSTRQKSPSTRQKSPFTRQKSPSNRQKSPSTRKKSPSKENLKHKSPARKNLRNPPKDNPTMGRSERRRSPVVRENLRRDSPSRQYGSERVRDSSRGRIRRRSPLERKNHPSEKDTDRRLLSTNEKRQFASRENNGSRSPLRNRRNSPPREDTRRNQNVRRESPPRKQEHYLPERKNAMRHSSPSLQQFKSGRDEVQRMSPRRNRRPYSPENYVRDRREQFSTRQHYSPGERSPPRNINRQYSPSRQDKSVRPDIRGYKEDIRSSTHELRGDSPIRERGRYSPDYFQRNKKTDSPRRSPYRGYNQVPATYQDQERFPFDDKNRSYSEKAQAGREFSSAHSDFREYSPIRGVDFRQPPPSYEPPREYPTFQDNMARFPPPSGDFRPTRIVHPTSDPPPGRDFYQHRDIHPARENTGGLQHRDAPGFFSSQCQNETQYYPPTRSDCYENRQYEKFSSEQKPPIREVRKFPQSREDTRPSDIARLHHFPPKKEGTRGDRRGFRQ